MKQNEKSMQDMKKPIKEKELFRHGVLHIALEIFAFVFVVLALCGGFFVWRLSSGPIDIAFAKPTIKEALRDSQTGMKIDFEQAVLQWPDLRGPLLLGLRDGRIYNRDDDLVIGIDSAAISLNKGKLLLGIVSPEGLILRKPSVSLTRDADNQFSIALHNQDVRGQSTAPVSIDDILDVFRPYENGQAGGKLAKLKLVKIENARVLVDDKVLSQSWQIPRLDLTLQREKDGMRGLFDVDIPRLPETAMTIMPNIEGEIFAGWDSRKILIESVVNQFQLGFLSDKMPQLKFLKGQSAQIDATVKMTLASDFSLENANVVVFSKEGSLAISEFDDENLSYQNFGARVIYDKGEKTAKLDGLTFTINDVTLQGTAEVLHEDGGFFEGFTTKGRVDVAEISRDQIASLWPAALEDDSSKVWMVDKTSEGVFRNFYTDFDLVAAPNEKDELSIELSELKSGFDFSGLSVKYKDSMAAATQGIGKGVFDYKSETIRIDLESAQILDMNVPKATLIFSNIIVAGKGQADLDIAVNGPFQSMLRYLSDEPINLRLDGDLADVKGSIDATVKLKFPTREDVLKEDVKIDVEGKIADVYLPMVIRDLPLSGGPFQVAVKDNLFSLTGKGQLDGQAIDLDYREFLYAEGQPHSSKTIVKMNIDNSLREKLGVDLSDFMNGLAAIDLVYTKKSDGSAEADVKADIGAAEFFLTPFDYNKPVGDAANLTLKAHLQDDDLVRISDLDINAPNLRMEPSLLGFRTMGDDTQLSSGKISRFEIGETKGQIDFEIGESGMLNLSMIASFFDMRPFLNDKGDDNATNNPPMRLSVKADKIRTADKEVISKGVIFADMNERGRFNQLEFDAIIGNGPVYMRFKPDENGKRVFQLEAQDAGATLRAFELYDDVRGGTLQIFGEPVSGDSDRNLIGKALISDFNVVDAPGLARILGAMSLPGAGEMLSGDGLYFSKLEADFDWLFRPQGSILVVKNGRTSGNSLGLTFAGTFNHEADKINIGGTIIPLSGINNLLKNIPLVGNILGGSSGLFAATYKIKGTGKDAKVSVNPLSVLAPGILRSILFEDSVFVKDDLSRQAAQ